MYTVYCKVHGENNQQSIRYGTLVALSERNPFGKPVSRCDWYGSKRVVQPLMRWQNHNQLFIFGLKVRIGVLKARRTVAVLRLC
jgi:hypothetical protein